MALDLDQHWDTLRSLAPGLNFSKGPEVEKAERAMRNYFNFAMDFQEYQRQKETDPKFAQTIILAACLKKFLKQIKDGKWPGDHGDVLDELLGYRTDKYVSHVIKAYEDSLREKFNKMEARAAKYVEILGSDALREEFDSITRIRSDGSLNYTDEQKRTMLTNFIIGMDASPTCVNFLLDSVSVDLGDLVQSVDPFTTNIPLFHPARLDHIPQPNKLNTFNFNHIDPNSNTVIPEKAAEVDDVAQKVLEGYLVFAKELVPYVAGAIAKRNLSNQRFAQVCFKILNTIYPNGTFPYTDKDNISALFAKLQQQFGADQKAAWIQYPPKIAACILLYYSFLGVLKSYNEFSTDQDTKKLFNATRDISKFVVSVGEVVVATNMISKAASETLETHLKQFNVVATGLELYTAGTDLYEAGQSGGDISESIGPAATMAGASLAFYTAAYAALTAGAITAETGPGAVVVAVVVFGLALAGSLLTAWTKPSLQELYVGKSFFGKRLGKVSDSPTDVYYEFFDNLTLGGESKEVADLQRQIGVFLGFLGLLRHVTWSVSKPNRYHLVVIDIYFNMPVSIGDEIYVYDYSKREFEVHQEKYTFEGLSGARFIDTDKLGFQFSEHWTKPEQSEIESDELRLKSLRVVIGYQHDDLLSKYHEFAIKIKNPFSAHLQRQIIGEMMEVPAQYLIYNEPLTIYYRFKPSDSPPQEQPPPQSQNQANDFPDAPSVPG